jgi:periplasmic protein TonB
MNRTDALAVGGALSLALHMALYSLFLGTVRRPVGPSDLAESRSPVQVRLVPQPALVQRTPESVRSTTDSQQPASVAAPELRLSASAPTVSLRGSAPSERSREQGGGAYLPRSMLTVGPSPLGVVVIPYPRFIGDQGWYAVQVSLYIDESGVVRRVEFDDQDLPAALQAAVREAFISTPFAPGEINGDVVRSHVRIEVTFGARPTR